MFSWVDDGRIDLIDLHTFWHLPLPIARSLIARSLPASLLILHYCCTLVYTVFVKQEMGVEGERKRLEMAGATGAIEEGYRQGLTAHATRLNKVRLDLVLHRTTAKGGAAVEGAPDAMNDNLCLHNPWTSKGVYAWVSRWLEYAVPVRTRNVLARKGLLLCLLRCTMPDGG